MRLFPSSALSHPHVSHAHANSQPQWHGLYAALFPLAQPTPLATQLHKLKDNNKQQGSRLRATEQALAQCHRDATTDLDSCRIDSTTAIDRCHRQNSHVSLLAHEKAGALYNTIDTLSAALNHTLLVLEHTGGTCTTKEQGLVAKLNANQRKVEAGKLREQRLTETINQCGQQLQQQTAETTHINTQLAAANGTCAKAPAPSSCTPS